MQAKIQVSKFPHIADLHIVNLRHGFKWLYRGNTVPTRYPFLARVSRQKIQAIGWRFPMFLMVCSAVLVLPSNQHTLEPIYTHYQCQETQRREQTRQRREQIHDIAPVSMCSQS